MLEGGKMAATAELLQERSNAPFVKENFRQIPGGSRTIAKASRRRHQTVRIRGAREERHLTPHDTLLSRNLPSEDTTTEGERRPPLNPARKATAAAPVAG